VKLFALLNETLELNEAVPPPVLLVAATMFITLETEVFRAFDVMLDVLLVY
jgi:hypothetical protein